jgi:hypothetical protein
MNDPENPNVTSYADEFDECVRENPIGAIVAAVGLGLVLALIVRLLQPPKPANRALRILHDIQDRLQELAEPAYRGASRLAGEGAAAMKSGMEHLADTGIEQNWRKIRRRLKGLLH